MSNPWVQLDLTDPCGLGWVGLNFFLTHHGGLGWVGPCTPLVTRIASIRILFAIVSIYKLVVHQMDVKTAFLNGDLEEKIYIEQPKGYVVLG